MTEASYSEIRINVRRAIRDNYGLLWDDSALDDLINEAQREYSILTGSLIGVYDVVTTQDGICAAPDNFIEPVKFIASDGFEKPFFPGKTARRLSGFPHCYRICNTGALYGF